MIGEAPAATGEALDCGWIGPSEPGTAPAHSSFSRASSASYSRLTRSSSACCCTADARCASVAASFTNQTLAQIELWANNKDGKYKKEVYVLPKSLDEKVARLHLAKIGVKLTELRKDQADYIGVKPEGPYKPEAYRY